MNMANLFTLAAAVPSKSVQATGWFLETEWLIPALPALSFFLILFFGVGDIFVLSLVSVLMGFLTNDSMALALLLSIIS